MASGEANLTLSERLESAITKLGFWYRITIIFVIVGLVSLSGIISASQIYFHQEIGQHGHIEEIYLADEDVTLLAFIPYSEEIFPADGIVTLYMTQIWLMVGNGIVIGLLSFLFLWVTYRGHSHRKEFESIERQFIRQSYLVNFETSIPEGETRVEKILNQSSLVFPALKELQRGEYANSMRVRKDVSVGSEQVDAVVSTKKGDFIVKFYDKQVTFDDLSSLCSALAKGRSRVFRVLCIAKDFDDDLQSNKLVDLMDSIPKYFKLDLIFEEEQGYSMLWID
ncbi:MAG: hypothetical protein DWQ18_03710 [Crenarchaeota archaeon]|nr:MAG: hypothetical protein DWQ17_09420 [Thermoproteota archaeon]RDJ34018.1 MAG: hypothetical protein DWQ18_03710 [Thermoproteota archaeon]RDJ36867.1 MAG: hypothetical protein DWQ13_06905 [Thermoproteota archaeon]RDJ37598.1 MAG: hypothetical protein DWQ19_03930 [Thermoproteota archaeon]